MARRRVVTDRDIDRCNVLRDKCIMNVYNPEMLENFFHFLKIFQV